MLKKTLILATLGCALVTPALACTLFGATGDDFVQDGGTLVCKVRDEIPSHQTLKYVAPADGYRYLGLYAGASAKFNVSGVNEKGLFVGLSTAGSFPKEIRKAAPVFRSEEGLRGNEYLLRYATSVDDALTHTEVFKEPVNYILADNKTVAFVEVFPDGKYAVKKINNGTLAHTNHYVTEEGLPFNKTIGASSATRYDRINYLLDNTSKPLTMANFIAFTNDRHDGLTKSIWRLGVKPDGVQSLACFIVHIPKTGSPEVYVKFRAEPQDHGHEETYGPKVYTF